MNIDTSCMSLMGMYWHFWVVSHEHGGRSRWLLWSGTIYSNSQACFLCIVICSHTLPPSSPLPWAPPPSTLKSSSSSLFPSRSFRYPLNTFRMQTASVSLALDLMFYTSVLEHLQSETAPCMWAPRDIRVLGGERTCTIMSTQTEQLFLTTWRCF